MNKERNEKVHPKIFGPALESSTSAVAMLLADDVA